MLDLQGLQTSFYVIKVIRLNRCLSLFNVHEIMLKIKNYMKEYLIQKAEDDPVFASDQISDNNKIG